ncbi:MAG TPA: 2-succinyl-6-hydroxy-2,4-cyclohexadiene-1-carboxylate synthase [Candidatus Binataceae bacterium]|nr:2-succinyl-6-hydroxy-2,4-cyclohexadiene-1-carboxylate synthase [Candidatus Binataceae bacterium]
MIRRLPTDCGWIEIADEGSCRCVQGNASHDPVVLLHGFTGDKDIWLELRERLAANRRVISFDLPGHGGTRIGDRIENYSIESAAAMLVTALTTTLSIPRFTLIGYSMGGRLALFIALRYAASVSRLVIESASAGISDPGERARRRADDTALAEFIRAKGIVAFVDRWEAMALFQSLAALPPETLRKLREQRLTCSPAGLACSLLAMGSGSQPWLGGELPQLRLPVLVMAGALDRKFADLGGSLSSVIPGSRLQIIDRAGHLPHLERPARFLRIVTDFLNEAG